MKPALAQRRIQAFRDRFGEAHFVLATHAAFPLALTPDLLYQLWANFQQDIQGKVLNIPWLAVSDLLLSSLCDEVGHELYEMPKEVRNNLLADLKANSRFGSQRINELSDFLMAHVKQQLESHDPDIRDFAQAQKWIALAYVKPNEVAREIASIFASLSLRDGTEWVRKAAIVETFAESMEEFEPLLTYACGMKNIVIGDLERATLEFNRLKTKVNTLGESFEIAGVSLVIPKVKSKIVSQPILDLRKFFVACNPSKTLDLENPADRQYYIDFSPVRGGNIIRELERTILLLSDEPTCQTFAGHIGCGKSTELLHVKFNLEQQGFHVVYFESSDDLDMGDVDITDILLTIARQVSASLESVGVRVKPKYFTNLLNEIQDFLQTPIALGAAIEFAVGIGKITARTKDSPRLRNQLRQYLEPRTGGILESINKELLSPATDELKRQGKQGLVVIVDNLDRVDARQLQTERTQPEYLFIDRGDIFSKLNCHLVYTIPVALIYSNEAATLQQGFGGSIARGVLPIIPVRTRAGIPHIEGIHLLRQMILARAFPEAEPARRIDYVAQVFDSLETLDRLCLVSGGHIRSLLGLLSSCLQQQDPPITRDCLENEIKRSRDDFTRVISEDEWARLRRVAQLKYIQGDPDYQTLLRRLFVFEYRNIHEVWFDVNPILLEAKNFQQF